MQKQKSNEQCQAEIFACAFFGTLVSVLVAGMALIGDATVLQTIGWAMVGWVAGWFWAASSC